MKFKNILNGIKVGAKLGIAIGVTVATGKVHDTLRKAGLYIDLTEKVTEEIRKANEEVRKK